jgi:integrase/recombinase XerD
VTDVKDPNRVRVVGPLAEYADGFRRELAQDGYAPASATRQLELMANMSRWLADEGLPVGGLTPARVEMFVIARGKAGFQNRARPDRLVRYLRSVGAAPELPSAGDGVSGTELLLERYRSYLVRERNFAALTVRPYVRIARVFVASLSRAGELDVQRLTAAEVSRFVLAHSRGRSAGTMHNVTVILRSLLRFLHVDGVLAWGLTGAVPAVAPHARPLHRSLDAGAVERLLASCDRNTATGSRDHAILLLLARLGLRAGEVAAIELWDIDWRAGELVVRGKGDRWERVPVPVDVGEALADYVQAGRARNRGGRMFMRVKAPITPLTRDGINGVVKAACRRCGLPEVGPHALRHTLAVEVLRQGGSLAEIGELLRQRSTFTTAIYARVDRAALGELARVWPGGES